MYSGITQMVECKRGAFAQKFQILFFSAFLFIELFHKDYYSLIKMNPSDLNFKVHFVYSPSDYIGMVYNPLL